MSNIGQLMKLKARMQNLKIGAYLVCAIAMHCARAGNQAESPDLVVSKDGTYVSDLRSKLAWSRCVEGMRRDGKTCVGEPQLASHAGALSLASARAKAEGLRWRVPRVKELQRLMSKAAQSAQGVVAVFPAAPPDWNWTASANIDAGPVNQYDYKNIERGVTEQNANRMAFLHGWAVNMQTGEARGNISKRTRLSVRLVRQED